MPLLFLSVCLCLCLVLSGLCSHDTLCAARSLLWLGLCLLALSIHLLPAASQPIGPNPALSGTGWPAGTGPTLPGSTSGPDPPRLGKRQAPEFQRPKTRGSKLAQWGHLVVSVKDRSFP